MQNSAHGEMKDGFFLNPLKFGKTDWVREPNSKGKQAVLTYLHINVTVDFFLNYYCILLLDLSPQHDLCNSKEDYEYKCI